MYQPGLGCVPPTMTAPALDASAVIQVVPMPPWLPIVMLASAGALVFLIGRGTR